MLETNYNMSSHHLRVNSRTSCKSETPILAKKQETKYERRYSADSGSVHHYCILKRNSIDNNLSSSKANNFSDDHVINEEETRLIINKVLDGSISAREKLNFISTELTWKVALEECTNENSYNPALAYAVVKAYESGELLQSVLSTLYNSDLNHFKDIHTTKAQIAAIAREFSASVTSPVHTFTKTVGYRSSNSNLPVDSLSYIPNQNTVCDSLSGVGDRSWQDTSWLRLPVSESSIGTKDHSFKLGGMNYRTWADCDTSTRKMIDENPSQDKFVPVNESFHKRQSKSENLKLEGNIKLNKFQSFSSEYHQEYSKPEKNELKSSVTTPSFKVISSNKTITELKVEKIHSLQKDKPLFKEEKVVDNSLKEKVEIPTIAYINQSEKKFTDLKECESIRNRQINELVDQYKKKSIDIFKKQTDLYSFEPASRLQGSIVNREGAPQRSVRSPVSSNDSDSILAPISKRDRLSTREYKPKVSRFTRDHSETTRTHKTRADCRSSRISERKSIISLALTSSQQLLESGESTQNDYSYVPRGSLGIGFGDNRFSEQISYTNETEDIGFRRNLSTWEILPNSERSSKSSLNVGSQNIRDVFFLNTLNYNDSHSALDTSTTIEDPSNQLPTNSRKKKIKKIKQSNTGWGLVFKESKDLPYKQTRNSSTKLSSYSNHCQVDLGLASTSSTKKIHNSSWKTNNGNNMESIDKENEHNIVTKYSNSTESSQEIPKSQEIASNSESQDTYINQNLGTSTFMDLQNLAQYKVPNSSINFNNPNEYQNVESPWPNQQNIDIVSQNKEYTDFIQKPIQQTTQNSYIHSNSKNISSSNLYSITSLQNDQSVDSFETSKGQEIKNPYISNNMNQEVPNLLVKSENSKIFSNWLYYLTNEIVQHIESSGIKLSHRIVYGGLNYLYNLEQIHRPNVTFEKRGKFQYLKEVEVTTLQDRSDGKLSARAAALLLRLVPELLAVGADSYLAQYEELPENIKFTQSGIDEYNLNTNPNRDKNFGLNNSALSNIGREYENSSRENLSNQLDSSIYHNHSDNAPLLKSLYVNRGDTQPREQINIYTANSKQHEDSPILSSKDIKSMDRFSSINMHDKFIDSFPSLFSRRDSFADTITDFPQRPIRSQSVINERSSLKLTDHTSPSVNALHLSSRKHLGRGTSEKNSEVLSNYFNSHSMNDMQNRIHSQSQTSQSALIQNNTSTPIEPDILLKNSNNKALGNMFQSSDIYPNDDSNLQYHQNTQYINKPNVNDSFQRNNLYSEKISSNTYDYFNERNKSFINEEIHISNNNFNVPNSDSIPESKDIEFVCPVCRNCKKDQYDHNQFNTNHEINNVFDKTYNNEEKLNLKDSMNRNEGSLNSSYSNMYETRQEFDGNMSLTKNQINSPQRNDLIMQKYGIYGNQPLSNNHIPNVNLEPNDKLSQYKNKSNFNNPNITLNHNKTIMNSNQSLRNMNSNQNGNSNILHQNIAHNGENMERKNYNFDDQQNIEPSDNNLIQYEEQNQFADLRYHNINGSFRQPNLLKPDIHVDNYQNYCSFHKSILNQRIEQNKSFHTQVPINNDHTEHIRQNFRDDMNSTNNFNQSYDGFYNEAKDKENSINQSRYEHINSNLDNLDEQNHINSNYTNELPSSSNKNYDIQDNKYGNQNINLNHKLEDNYLSNSVIISPNEQIIIDDFNRTSHTDLKNFDNSNIYISQNSLRTNNLNNTHNYQQNLQQSSMKQEQQLGCFDDNRPEYSLNENYVSEIRGSNNKTYNTDYKHKESAETYNSITQQDHRTNQIQNYNNFVVQPELINHSNMDQILINSNKSSYRSEYFPVLQRVNYMNQKHIPRQQQSNIIDNENDKMYNLINNRTTTNDIHNNRDSSQPIRMINSITMNKNKHTFEQLNHPSNFNSIEHVDNQVRINSLSQPLVDISLPLEYQNINSIHNRKNLPNEKHNQDSMRNMSLNNSMNRTRNVTENDISNHNQSLINQKATNNSRDNISSEYFQRSNSNIQDRSNGYRLNNSKEQKTFQQRKRKSSSSSYTDRSDKLSVFSGSTTSQHFHSSNEPGHEYFSSGDVDSPLKRAKNLYRTNSQKSNYIDERNNFNQEISNNVADQNGQNIDFTNTREFSKNNDNLLRQHSMNNSLLEKESKLMSNDNSYHNLADRYHSIPSSSQQINNQINSLQYINASYRNTMPDELSHKEPIEFRDRYMTHNFTKSGDINGNGDTFRETRRSSKTNRYSDTNIQLPTAIYQNNMISEYPYIYTNDQNYEHDSYINRGHSRSISSIDNISFNGSNKYNNEVLYDSEHKTTSKIDTNHNELISYPSEMLNIPQSNIGNTEHFQTEFISHGSNNSRGTHYGQKKTNISEPMSNNSNPSFPRILFSLNSEDLKNNENNKSQESLNYVKYNNINISGYNNQMPNSLRNDMCAKHLLMTDEESTYRYHNDSIDNMSQNSLYRPNMEDFNDINSNFSSSIKSNVDHYNKKLNYMNTDTNSHMDSTGQYKKKLQYNESINRHNLDKNYSNNSEYINKDKHSRYMEINNYSNHSDYFNSTSRVPSQPQEELKQYVDIQLDDIYNNITSSQDILLKNNLDSDIYTNLSDQLQLDNKKYSLPKQTSPQKIITPHSDINSTYLSLSGHHSGIINSSVINRNMGGKVFYTENDKSQSKSTNSIHSSQEASQRLDHHVNDISFKDGLPNRIHSPEHTSSISILTRNTDESQLMHNQNICTLEYNIPNKNSNLIKHTTNNMNNNSLDISQNSKTDSTEVISNSRTGKAYSYQRNTVPSQDNTLLEFFDVNENNLNTTKSEDIMFKNYNSPNTNYNDIRHASKMMVSSTYTPISSHSKDIYPSYSYVPNEQNDSIRSRTSVSTGRPPIYNKQKKKNENRSASIGTFTNKCTDVFNSPINITTDRNTTFPGEQYYRTQQIKNMNQSSLNRNHRNTQGTERNNSTNIQNISSEDYDSSNQQIYRLLHTGELVTPVPGGSINMIPDRTAMDNIQTLNPYKEGKDYDQYQNENYGQNSTNYNELTKGRNLIHQNVIKIVDNKQTPNNIYNTARISEIYSNSQYLDNNVPKYNNLYRTENNSLDRYLNDEQVPEVKLETLDSRIPKKQFNRSINKVINQNQSSKIHIPKRSSTVINRISNDPNSIYFDRHVEPIYHQLDLQTERIQPAEDNDFPMQTNVKTTRNRENIRGNNDEKKNSMPILPYMTTPHEKSLLQKWLFVTAELGKKSRVIHDWLEEYQKASGRSLIPNIAYTDPLDMNRKSIETNNISSFFEAEESNIDNGHDIPINNLINNQSSSLRDKFSRQRSVSLSIPFKSERLPEPTMSIFKDENGNILRTVYHRPDSTRENRVPSNPLSRQTSTNLKQSKSFSGQENSQNYVSLNKNTNLSSRDYKSLSTQNSKKDINTQSSYIPNTSKTYFQIELENAKNKHEDLRDIKSSGIQDKPDHNHSQTIISNYSPSWAYPESERHSYYSMMNSRTNNSFPPETHDYPINLAKQQYSQSANTSNLIKSQSTSHFTNHPTTTEKFTSHMSEQLGTNTQTNSSFPNMDKSSNNSRTKPITNVQSGLITSNSDIFGTQPNMNFESKSNSKDQYSTLVPVSHIISNQYSLGSSRATDYISSDLSNKLTLSSDNRISADPIPSYFTPMKDNRGLISFYTESVKQETKSNAPVELTSKTNIKQNSFFNSSVPSTRSNKVLDTSARIQADIPMLKALFSSRSLLKDNISSSQVINTGKAQVLDTKKDILTKQPDQLNETELKEKNSTTIPPIPMSFSTNSLNIKPQNFRVNNISHQKLLRCASQSSLAKDTKNDTIKSVHDSYRELSKLYSTRLGGIIDKKQSSTRSTNSLANTLGPIGKFNMKPIMPLNKYLNTN